MDTLDDRRVGSDHRGDRPTRDPRFIARMPLSKSLGGGLFELRFTLGSTARRITYRFMKDGRIILLTTFRKQRNNERNEIIRARKAAEACAERYP